MTNGNRVNNTISAAELSQIVDFGKKENLISREDAKNINNLLQSTCAETKVVKTIISKPKIDLEELSDDQLKKLIATQEKKIKLLKKEGSKALKKLKKENSFGAKLKQMLVFSLMLSLLVLTVLLAFYVLVLPPIIAISASVYFTTLAIAFLSIFVLNLPLTWLLTSNKRELTKLEVSYEKLLLTENSLLKLLEGEKANRNKNSIKLEKVNINEKNLTQNKENIIPFNKNNYSKSRLFQNTSSNNTSDDQEKVPSAEFMNKHK
ncbi:MAG: hypothetical protein V4471_03875 [Pseudomonadota bacterium]